MNTFYSIVLKTDFDDALKKVNRWLTNEGFNIIDSNDFDELAGDSMNTITKCYRILCNYTPTQENDQGQQFVPQHYSVRLEEIDHDNIEVSFLNPEITYNAALLKRHYKIICKAHKSLLNALNDIDKNELLN